MGTCRGCGGAESGVCNVKVVMCYITVTTPDSTVHGANMGPTWVLLVPGGSQVGPMNLAISDCSDGLKYPKVQMSTFDIHLSICM